MTVYTYNCTSDRREIYKNLTSQATITNVILKDSTNVSDPTLIMARGTELPDTVNYFYIPDLGRYYYKTGIDTAEQRLMVHLHVDVLESKRAQLLNQSAVIDRSYNKFNIYQVDSDMPMRNDADITVKLFPNGFTEESWLLVTTGGSVA